MFERYLHTKMFDSNHLIMLTSGGKHHLLVEWVFQSLVGLNNIISIALSRLHLTLQMENVNMYHVHNKVKIKKKQ